MTPSLTRRALLGRAAVGTVVAVTHLPAAGNSGAAHFVLLHRSLGEAEAAALASRDGTAEVVELDLDVVRQWRDGLSRRLAGGRRVVAYAPWAEAKILSGLAREGGGKSLLSQMTGKLFKVVLTLPLS